MDKEDGLGFSCSGQRFSTLAYADDLVLFSRSAEGLVEVLSAVEEHRHADDVKTSLRKYDEAICALLKRAMWMPPNASTLWIYGDRQKGGCGPPPSGDDHALLRVSKAFRLLWTDSPKVKTHAITGLRHTVSAPEGRFQSGPPRLPQRG
ncbi:unnamed protein product [Soboliphyme baturini]|uniref:Reverse transcriptase domain-containing protein n=1 Tax=Soboliphyme baturini TaxID=241478 RepID=A0A183J834_9BILA|nr:unnamed protein product [Soboliphyme baturini]